MLMRIFSNKTMIARMSMLCTCAALALAMQPNGVAFAQSAATASAELKWGKWTYLQSDKAVQYRVAKLAQTGDVATLQYQLRIEPDNDIACYSERCEGYVIYLAVFDPVARDFVAKHHLFFPAKSPVIYDVPEKISFPIRTSDTGRRFIDEATGLPMYEILDEPGRLRVTEVLQACVDDRITNYADNRCTDFDEGQAVTIR